jgi:hypothetical protein
MPTLSHVHQRFRVDTCHTSIHALRWKDRPFQCPHCHSPEVGPWGTYHDRPGFTRDRCKDCGRTFNDLTKTLFAQSQRSAPLFATSWAGTSMSRCLSWRNVVVMPTATPRAGLKVEGSTR